MASIAFPSGPKPAPHVVADWCEVVALTEGRPFKRGDLKSAIAIEDIDNPDLLAENVWKLMESRGELHGHHWALHVERTRISARERKDIQLLHTYFSLISLGDLENTDRTLFEELVTDIFKWRWGRSVMRIGHPASPGMSTSFKTRLKTYARISHISAMEMPSPPFAHDKDLGLDVMAWLPTPDRRGGFPHLFIQCATGNDWKGKLNDIDHGKLRFHLDVAAGYMRAFCVPFTLATTREQWTRYSGSGGWIVDRPRLLFLAEGIALEPSRVAQLNERIAYLAD